MTHRNFRKSAWLIKGVAEVAVNKGKMLKPALRSGKESGKWDKRLAEESEERVWKTRKFGRRKKEWPILREEGIVLAGAGFEERRGVWPGLCQKGRSQMPDRILTKS